ncbi:MAG: SEL1-like repeat protein [Methylobacteriaceae bacterium]|nr:SEL1-like repeat protein [Methylobacteriaceae bacterium]
MARFEMSSSDMAALAPVAAPAEVYYELGCMYAAGRSVEPDLVVAHQWLNVAAARGFGPAAARRAEIAAEMTAAQISNAQRSARLWLSRQH